MELPTWPHAEPPFHEGEQAIQARLGVAARMAEVGRRVIRGQMPGQHREFFEQLPFVVLGAADSGGQPWATLLSGPPGFVRSPGDRHLHLAALPAPEDPLAPLLAPGQALGLLGIEPATRRRNRANGVVAALRPGGFEFEITQSFGNCPRHIHPRRLEPADPTPGPAATQRSDRLAARQVDLVRTADTFFLATQALPDRASGGSDVSHRGGEAGFVSVAEDGRSLWWPDFPGNQFFNSLGNLQLQPRCGLVFCDFARGDLLHLAGRAEILWDRPTRTGTVEAERLVRLDIDEVWFRPGAFGLRLASTTGATGAQP